MTSDVTLSGTITKAQNTGQQSVKLAEDFSQFLTLLTTHLQNQDPLSPMDSTEFTNQLVQFSQVEQSINTNQKLDSLLSLQLASISSVALGYRTTRCVGRANRTIAASGSTTSFASCCAFPRVCTQPAPVRWPSRGRASLDEVLAQFERELAGARGEVPRA